MGWWLQRLGAGRDLEFRGNRVVPVRANLPFWELRMGDLTHSTVTTVSNTV